MKYTKISIIIKPEEKPPYFIGSQLRGAFGYALKKVTCINPGFKCDDCFATSNCLYYEFYEQKNEYHKYRFDFELGLGYYNFDFYLFNDATTKLPYVISAFYQMVTNIGFGRDRVIYKKFDMFINDENCFIDGQLKLPQNYVREFICEEYYPNIILKLITPLRIKKQNKFLRNDIDLLDILSSINKRFYKLIGKEYQKLDIKKEYEIVIKDIKYKELTRHSNRQKTNMNLGGIIGNIQIQNIDKKSYKLLKLGEIIGVGKSTVFGNGKIKTYKEERGE